MAIPLEDDDDEILNDKKQLTGRRKFISSVPDIHRESMKPDPGNIRPHFYARNRKKRDQEDLMLDYKEPPRDVKESINSVGVKPRASSLNRRPSRAPSKERGGTQLPTWAETRTTRLRRSKALGENKPANANHLPKKTVKASSSNNTNPKNNSNGVPSTKKNSVTPKQQKKEIVKTEQRESEFSGNIEDADDDDNGKILMERIRANSRCLRARLSSHTRRNVSGTGAGSRSSDLAKLDARYNSGYNGVYTMHARRNQRATYGSTDSDILTQDQGAGVEDTSVTLVDSEGNEFEADKNVDIKTETVDKPEPNGDEPEIVHLHTLSVDGEDARDQLLHSSVIETEGHYEEPGEKENFAANDSTETAPEEPEVPAIEGQSQDHSKDPTGDETNDPELATPDAPDGHDPDKHTIDDLEEGQVVNRRGENLTIEVEVKEVQDGDGEVGDAPVSNGDALEAPSQRSPILLDIDDSIQYDSYPVYSEQNLPYTSSVEFPVPAAPSPDGGVKFAKKSGKTRRDSSRNRSTVRKQDKPQYSRGIYLRKREHRDRSISSMRRSQSDGNGLDDIPDSIVRTTSRTRRGGMGSIEKWNTTSSTGDLTDLPWNQVSEKERLLSILDSIRAETRAREKQREELLRRIKHLQNRVAERREQGEEIENNANNIDNEQNRCLRSLPKFAKRAESAAVREMWRKRYLEAKKVTPRLEEECSRLRQELEKLHRELLAKVQAGVWALLTISGKTEKPSNKLSYKIMIARLLQEIEDLSRRVEGTRLKLHTEVKLRAMAEKDVRNLREELLKKKIQVTLTRNQEQATMGNGIRQQYFISAV